MWIADGMLTVCDGSLANGTVFIAVGLAVAIGVFIRGKKN
jgi:hypothetical protein